MKTTTLLGACAALLLSSFAWAQNCPAQSVWPTPDWEARIEQTKANKATEIAALEEAIFTLTGKDDEREGYRTNSMVIIKDGYVIYEKYARGFSAKNKHLSWSVAKSITSTLAGVAVLKGEAALDDSICKYVEGYSGPVCDITLKHAITFATGLDWREEYENASYQVSSVISMLYGEGHRDQLSHIVKRHKVASTPGTQWSYSTGDAQLASAVVKGALKKAHGDDAFWKVLFTPLGITDIVFEEDVKGTPLGGSMIYATPRDFARFGYLMLNDGCWNGTRLLPEGWVTSATTPSDVYVTSAVEKEKTPSGYSWWLNQPMPTRSQEKPWADAPEDAYAALGHWGQRIIVVPSMNLVVVRTGDDRKGSIPANLLLKHAIEVAK